MYYLAHTHTQKQLWSELVLAGSLGKQHKHASPRAVVLHQKQKSGLCKMRKGLPLISYDVIHGTFEVREPS